MNIHRQVVLSACLVAAVAGWDRAVEARRVQAGPNAITSADRAAAVSFEGARPGAFDKLETSIGVWEPGLGRSLVDSKHAKTGKRCLQLAGGPKTIVTLRIADGVDTSGVLSFWAERWTVRKPFSFRIEKHDGREWKEIYDGDTQVRVGRAFLSHVKVPLGDVGIKQLRFTVTSPPDTGILIDDLRIAEARPQKIASVEVVPFSLPALVGAAACPLVKLKVVTTGDTNPLSISSVDLRLMGDNAALDPSTLFVYPGTSSARSVKPPLRWLRSASVDRNARRRKASTFDGPPAALRPAERLLAEGENTIWIAGSLRKDANLDRQVGAQVEQLRFSNGRTITLNAAPSMQRVGVAVRKAGDDGVHTYRIPGLTTTNQGTLIGVYDVRRRSGGDLPGDIDVGMSRSTDGGRTWEPMKVIMDRGADPKWRYDGIGDPAVLVDRNSGAIWVAATWSHGERSWRGSGPGLAPEETGQLMLVRSTDDGVTWSKPINITKQVKRPEWCFVLQGPGKGITMRDGTLVFAAQYQDPPSGRRLPHATIIYSKDQGKTWRVGTGAADDTTESQVVEVEPGVLMLNCRYNRKSVRVVMTTRDMGATWTKHPTSERALIEPRSCMASLIDADREAGADLGGWLLFSNPDSTQGRRRMTIKASSDRGATWPSGRRLLLDEGDSAGYSCMTMIDAETVGILYEGSQAQMTFQRIPLADVVRNRPASEPTGNSPPSSRAISSEDASKR